MTDPEKQIVTFVVDKMLDISNHAIAVNVFRKNENFSGRKDENVERLAKIVSQEELFFEIEKNIAVYYIKQDKLFSLASDINEEWKKIEKIFIDKLEEIHQFPFPLSSVKGVLSSAFLFGYNTDEGWFATNMRGNKFIAIDVATHELMHFMFHKYYDIACVRYGLSKNQMWDVKESFTVLLNIECRDIRFQDDVGYSPHRELREVIKNSWLKEKDFCKVLKSAVRYVKNEQCKN